MAKEKQESRMKRAQAAERAAKLRDTLHYHGHRYHVLDDPEISDAAYDALLHELIALEEAYPDLRTSDSPTQRVGGAPLEKFSKVRHDVPQWSFDNVFGEEEFIAFDDRVKKGLGKPSGYVCELKIDGFKIVLTYKKGVLSCAATRGDGSVGEDATENVKRIPSIPLKLTRAVDCTVEGEIWMGKSGLVAVNKEREKKGEPLFANPRNAAAGSIRQLDPSIVASRRLKSFIYDIGALSTGLPETQLEELELLQELGFKVNRDYRFAKDAAAVLSYVKEWETKKDKQDYLCDGVVAKVHNRRDQEKLGYTAKSPRFGVAFKFPAEQATTVLEDIVLQVGRTGVVTPVAHLRPVRVAGSLVSRATLHNEDQIKRLDVRVGDTVILQKAGDVIPEIVSVVKNLRPKSAKPYAFPEYVEACGGPIERIPGEAAYRCVEKNSFAQLSRRLAHFAGKHAFDIDGLGPQIVEFLMKENLVQSSADFFTLTKGDLVDLEGFAEKSADNLVAAIAARKRIAFPRFLVGLSIPHVGEEIAILLAEHFGSFEKLRKAGAEEIASIHGVGEKIADAVTRWFHDARNKTMLDGLLAHVRVEKTPKKERKGAFSGKTVVVTGTLESLSRDEAKARIRDAGGKSAGSVSAKTDYLVAGENAGSKLEDAKKHGVKILSEKEFLALLS